MIEFKKVNKDFNKKNVLKDLTFKIKKGEIVGLLGPNGAGKTTTMRLILGFLKPTNGKINVLDNDPQEKRIEVLSQIGYLPENNPLYSDLTVEEYLYFICEVKKDDIDNLYKTITDVSLQNVLKSKIENLSRGYRQRVGLAASLLGNPQILILDEPTSGLDPIEQDNIRELIKKLGKKRTIILSTHILSEIEDVASRIMIINNGELIFDKPKPKKRGEIEKIFKKLVK